MLTHMMGTDIITHLRKQIYHTAKAVYHIALAIYHSKFPAAVKRRGVSHSVGIVVSVGAAVVSMGTEPSSEE